MKTPHEVQQAIDDLIPLLAEGGKNDRALAAVAIDLLKWVLGKNSVCGPVLAKLRETRKEQYKRGIQ